MKIFAIDFIYFVRFENKYGAVGVTCLNNCRITYC